MAKEKKHDLRSRLFVFLQVLLFGMGVRPRRRFQTVDAMRKELYSR